MIRKLLGGLLLFLYPVLAAGKKEVHRIELDGEVYEISFDNGRIEWPAVRDILKLAPDLNYAYYPPVTLALCADESADYAPCGTRDINDKNFFKNAEVNLRQAADRLKELSSMQVPAGLAAVRDYLFQCQQFSRWLAETQFHYFRTWRIESLRQDFANDRLLSVCDPVVQKLQNAKSIQEKYQLVSYDWNNCEVEAHRQILENYPKAAWERWLADNGISMIYVGHIDP